MENGMDLSKLESVVEKMIVKFDQIKKEKADLEEALKAKDQTIEELNAKIDNLSSSQQEISSRVTSLINSIEEWECDSSPADEAASDEAMLVEQDTEESNSKQEAQLF